MISTVIADDDIEMLDWLEQIIPWEEYGFKIVARAQSGSEALEICKAEMPDVIITDITMPSISGLDLINEIKNIKPDIKSVIITCHEDFSYAQRALKVEADDYLLKYTLTSQSLIEVLKRLKNKLNTESAKKEEMYLLNKEIASNRTVLEEKFITDIIDGNLVKWEEIQRRSDVLKIKLSEKPFRIVCSFIDNYDKDIENCPFTENNLLKFCIMNIAEEIMQNEREVKCFPYGRDKIIMIYSDGSSDVFMKQRTLLRIKEFLNLVKGALKMNMSSCVSSVYDSFTDFGTAVKEATTMRDSYFFEGNGVIITQKKFFPYSDICGYLDQFRKDFIPALNTGDKSAINKLLQNLYAILESKTYTPAATKKMLSKIALDIQLAENKEENKDIQTNIDTYQALKEIFNKVVDSYLENLNGTKHQAIRKEIESVLSFIKANLNENITCESMASLVNMNSSYFSRLFKSEVGINFSDYLIGKRIEKATNFLKKTEMTIEEITKAVGLEQPSYFYKLYKKVTGKTPGEVRNNK